MRVRIDKSTPNEFGTYMKVQLIAIVFSGCFFLESFNPAGLNEVACCIVKKKVMRSIRDNITEEVLLTEIREIVRLPMYADRIWNDSKAHQHTNAARRR